MDLLLYHLVKILLYQIYDFLNAALSYQSVGEEPEIKLQYLRVGDVSCAAVFVHR